MRFYFLYTIIFISFILCDDNLKSTKNHDFEKRVFSQQIQNTKSDKSFANLKQILRTKREY